MTTTKTLIANALMRRKMRLQKNQTEENNFQETLNYAKFPELCSFANYPVYQDILRIRSASVKYNINDPFFRILDGVPRSTIQTDEKIFVNFASYNYLNLNGDPRVVAAAKEAIDRYGTSVSASRVMSGERSIQQKLENELAMFYGVERSLVFVSGHATNVTTIGYLFGEKDLILHDELIHDSVRQGIKLAGSTRLSFPHNDWKTLDKLLCLRRHNFQRVLIVLEGMYGMDGDFPNLPEFVEVKKRHSAFLMVDEAHSLGVMGKTGRGIGEHFNINPSDVDIWMGTLSKTLAGCGGYIAGTAALVDHLKIAAPGFLYSVGISPPLVAASFTALEILLQEPERVAALCSNGKQFLHEAKKNGLNTGLSIGLNIVPILCGSSRKAVQLSNSLYKKNIYVQPIIYPGVQENQARLRFFMSSAHTPEQITNTIKIISKLI
ncbi:MAG: 8-amino-7-oxononanoate synthase [Gammaproteobacteria bacterium RIFCSPHIGHO2_12_FULL_38_11]|nr:MAG: 8-amino-7-oxononanoate synthase [Gammaproteobacteria bacterium RIFCSPHIGHO2_12_FULL_38_11]